ncbi:hypothetical protein EDB92DRAFT_1801048 [Lactarius akahatsu]|uniref:Uncharacterized protein n=1 Tax=Lactarius akahatsu TaxID=416441 RepID=A0AAD4QBU2_9AGAM|nr:hypothetical protein EDB92DRAFT_1801048 [Lactarius akahatsu]
MIPFFFFFSPRYASAYTWQFTSQPSQCQNVSIAVQGSGQPPYNLLLVPSGPTPLPNNTEVRTIQNISFTGTSTSLSFKLNYPENSSFVAVVSDSSGFGSGGTSTPVTVLQSSDSSCYDTTKSVQGPWVFSVSPTGGITQCESVRLWWEQEFINGTVNFYGVIPGGNSFNIPQGSLSTNTDTGTGFNWTVDITGGTNIFVVAGDDRGIGSGGSAPFTVAYSANSSCLSGSSPSSTAGSPAGGSYPTSTSSSPSGSSGGHSNVGAIAGGVAGGLVAIVATALVGFFYFRRQKYSAVSKERPVNVLHDDDDDGSAPPHDLPQYYAPEPYLVPDPTIVGTSEAASTHDRPLSMTTADIPRPQTPGSMNTATSHTRKSALPPQLRPVNIIQHDDAGPSEVPTSAGEPETIELPPAYTNIRSAQRPPDTTPVPTTDSTPAPTETTTS